MQTSKKVVVVGAGAAGLSAAYELTRQGVTVEVLEMSDHPGGRMHTVDWHGFRIETGASFLTTKDVRMLEIMRELGLADKILRPKPGLNITVPRDGKFHTANFMSVFSYFKWSGVSFKARLSMLKLVYYFMKMGKLRSVYHLEDAYGDGDTLSIEDFFRLHISGEMFDWWAEPMFQVMCAYKGNDLSQNSFLALMTGYLGADTLTFAGGLGTLPEAMAKTLNITYGAQVTRITTQGEGGLVKLEVKKGDSLGWEMTADAVIVAVPGNAVLPMMPALPSPYRRVLSSVAYSSGAMHYFLCRTDFVAPVESLFLPRILNLPINNISFEGRKDGNLLVMVDPNVYTDWAEQDTPELAQRAMATIVQFFPQLQGTFIDNRIFRWNTKVPAFRPGYLRDLKFFAAYRAMGPVFFAGDYLGGPSAAAAMSTGLEAADQVREFLK